MASNETLWVRPRLAHAERLAGKRLEPADLLARSLWRAGVVCGEHAQAARVRHCRSEFDDAHAGQPAHDDGVLDSKHLGGLRRDRHG
eukprot:4440662-Prymnesium_polylepis.1